MGDVDLLGEVQGVGDYKELVNVAETVDLDGWPTKILSIAALITTKEGAREKDKSGLMVLYALQESVEIEEEDSPEK